MILEILVFQAVCADSYLGQAELDSPGWDLGLLWQHPASGNRTTGTYALTSLFPLITCAKEINKTNSSSFFQNKRENKQNKLQTQTTIKTRKPQQLFKTLFHKLMLCSFLIFVFMVTGFPDLYRDVPGRHCSLFLVLSQTLHQEWQWRCQLLRLLPDDVGCVWHERWCHRTCQGHW